MFFMFLLQLSKKVFFYWLVNTDKPNFVSFLFFVGTAIMFSAKQHSDCGHWWPEIQLHNADGLFQTGNRKKKMSASWIRKTSHKNKGNEKRLETLFTHRWSNIKFLIFTQTSFYCGFDRYKVMDCFLVQLVN